MNSKVFWFRTWCAIWLAAAASSQSNRALCLLNKQSDSLPSFSQGRRFIFIYTPPSHSPHINSTEYTRSMYIFVFSRFVPLFASTIACVFNAPHFRGVIYYCNYHFQRVRRTNGKQVPVGKYWVEQIDERFIFDDTLLELATKINNTYCALVVCSRGL